MTQRPQYGTVTQAYQRVYDDPIKVNAGDEVRITERDLWNNDEQSVWLWCINGDDKGGWAPEHFIEVSGDVGIAKRDYNAIELNVEAGQEVEVVEEVNGWYWVTTPQQDAGWVPTTHITLL